MYVNGLRIQKHIPTYTHAIILVHFMFQIYTHFWSDQTIKAFHSGVPDKIMLILDLFAEEGPVWIRTELFFGKPVIRCMQTSWYFWQPYHHSNSTYVCIDARLAKGSIMVGTGMTPEAIEQNPLVYELMVSIQHICKRQSWCLGLASNT